MYFAHYMSSNNSGKSFMSAESDLSDFPPAVTMEDVAYRLLKVYQASTPSARKSLAEFCETRNIDQNVEISAP